MVASEEPAISREATDGATEGALAAHGTHVSLATDVAHAVLAAVMRRRAEPLHLDLLPHLATDRLLQGRARPSAQGSEAMASGEAKLLHA